VRFDDGSQVFADARTFVQTQEELFVSGSLLNLLAQNQSSKYGATAFGDTRKSLFRFLKSN
jgi:hypothetical protein